MWISRSEAESFSPSLVLGYLERCEYVPQRGHHRMTGPEVFSPILAVFPTPLSQLLSQRFSPNSLLIAPGVHEPRRVFLSCQTLYGTGGARDENYLVLRIAPPTSASTQMHTTTGFHPIQATNGKLFKIIGTEQHVLSRVRNLRYTVTNRRAGTRGNLAHRQDVYPAYPEPPIAFARGRHSIQTRSRTPVTNRLRQNCLSW